MTNDLRGAWRLSAVRSLEVVRISEVKMYAVNAAIGRGMWFVRCTEVVRFSECPLSEVPLYNYSGAMRQIDINLLIYLTHQLSVNIYIYICNV